MGKLTNHKYNGAIDRINVNPNKKYIVDEYNNHESQGIMMIHDLFNEIPQEFYKADYVIVDPPYNDSAMKSYYRKANLEPNKTSKELFERIFYIMKEINVNSCYMEVGILAMEYIKDKMSSVFDNVKVIESFYYGNKPCYFVVGENKGFELDFDETPKDELKVIDEIISKKDGIVLDFCLGRGAISRTAYKHKKRFIGTELNINRFAVSLEDIMKKGADIKEIDK